MVDTTAVSLTKEEITEYLIHIGYYGPRSNQISDQLVHSDTYDNKTLKALSFKLADLLSEEEHDSAEVEYQERYKKNGT